MSRQGEAAAIAGDLRPAMEQADQAAIDRGDGQRIGEPGRAVGDAQLERGEARRGTDRPPDMRRVLDGAGGDQHIDIIAIGGVVFEKGRQAGARQFVIGGKAIEFHAGIAAAPKGRRRAERQQQRQERQPF